jgi:hypothetical protein
MSEFNRSASALPVSALFQRWLRAVCLDVRRYEFFMKPYSLKSVLREICSHAEISAVMDDDARRRDIRNSARTGFHVAIAMRLDHRSDEIGTRAIKAMRGRQRNLR